MIKKKEFNWVDFADSIINLSQVGIEKLAPKSGAISVDSAKPRSANFISAERAKRANRGAEDAEVKSSHIGK